MADTDEDPFSPAALERRASAANAETEPTPAPGAFSPGQEDHDFFPGIKLGRTKVSGFGTALRGAGGAVVPAATGIASSGSMSRPTPRSRSSPVWRPMR